MTSTTSVSIADAHELRCGGPGCPCQRGRNRHCPGPGHAHGDRNPSLTVDRLGDRDLFHCKSGCTQAEVIEALETLGLWRSRTSSTPSPTPRSSRRPSTSRPASPAAPAQPSSPPAGPWALVQEWPYADPDTGEVLAYHGRFERPLRDGSFEKQYRWRLPAGTYQQGLQGELSVSDLPLYNGHLLRSCPDGLVYLVEGERAADACTDHGLLAVTLGGGAAQTNFGNALAPLMDRDVALWPDNDDAGRALMQRVTSALPQARTLHVPDLPPKGDAVDFFEGRTDG